MRLRNCVVGNDGTRCVHNNITKHSLRFSLALTIPSVLRGWDERCVIFPLPSILFHSLKCFFRAISQMFHQINAKINTICPVMLRWFLFYFFFLFALNKTYLNVLNNFCVLFSMYEWFSSPICFSVFFFLCSRKMRFLPFMQSKWRTICVHVVFHCSLCSHSHTNGEMECVCVMYHFLICLPRTHRLYAVLILESHFEIFKCYTHIYKYIRTAFKQLTTCSIRRRFEMVRA